MNYQLPDPRTLDIGELKEYRLTLVNQLKLVNEQIQMMCYSECSICETPEIARGIPDGWGFLVSIPGYLLCSKCIANWTKKFREAPKVFREGDELSEE